MGKEQYYGVFQKMKRATKFFQEINSLFDFRSANGFSLYKIPNRFSNTRSILKAHTPHTVLRTFSFVRAAAANNRTRRVPHHAFPKKNTSH